jgi:hypothetical protein
MPTPHQPTVRNLLKERGRDVILRNAIEDAWSKVKAMPDRAWWRRKTTSAELIWEHMVHNAIAGFADDPDVRVVAHHDTISFVIEDMVLLRLKKADLQLRTRNYPTAQASLFHTHEVDLFGHSGLQRVEATYVLNRFATDIDWIGIVAQEQDNVIWQFELGVEEDGDVIAFPAAAPAGPAADRVLKIKNTGAGDAAAQKNDK